MLFVEFQEESEAVSTSAVSIANTLRNQPEKKIKFQIKLTHCHSSWRNKSYSLRKKPTSTQWINLWKKKSPFLRKIWFKIQKSWCLPARKNMCMDEIDHGLRTPNEGINQWYLKNWADMHSELEWKFCVGFLWEGLQVTHMVFAYHWTS